VLDAVCQRRRVPLLCAALAVVAGGGCQLDKWYANGFKVGPNYCRPAAPVADAWIDSKSGQIKMTADEAADWWRVFNDPVLDGLIQQAYRQNLTLRSAGTRILAARAQRDIAAGNLFPQSQQVTGDISRNNVSGNIANPPPKRFFDHNSVGFNLSWELDFWGRFRRAVDAADAELDASIENYDDALVILISEVASTYVDIRVFQQRLNYVDQNIAIQRTLVAQAEGRLEGGVGRRIDQGQQRSNLTDTLALREQLEIGLRLANNRLCVLLGIPVRDLLPELGTGDIPIAPSEVAVGMPAELLRRRPDLRRAERLVKAQSERIGIAVADLYPHISLLGSMGYEAQNFGDLFSSRSFTGSIGPNLRWDVLNYGRLTNAIRVQDALFQTAAVDYQNAALRAGREVEDGIVEYLRAQKQSLFLADSAREARVAAEEAITLSRDVKFDLNQAFVTSNFLTGQQDKLARARGDIAQGLIQIYKALGGGWQIRCPETAVAQVVGPESPQGQAPTLGSAPGLAPVPGPGPMPTPAPQPPNSAPIPKAAPIVPAPKTGQNGSWNPPQQSGNSKSTEVITVDAQTVDAPEGPQKN